MKRVTTHLTARTSRDRDFWTWQSVQHLMPVGTPVPPLAKTVDIVEVTTTEEQRKDGTRMPNTRRETTETVLMSVPLDKVPQLIMALADATITGLDTRKTRS